MPMSWQKHICPVCQKEFWEYISNNRKYCSKKCYNKVNKGNPEKIKQVIKKRRKKRDKNYIVDNNNCWIWQGTLDKDGYGHTKVNGKTVGAHRYFYEKKKGKIPEGKVLDHICRKPACVNPNHLRVVTYAKNKRAGKGIKLSEKIIQEIKFQYKNLNITQFDLATLYDVNQSQISRVVNEKRWVTE